MDPNKKSGELIITHSPEETYRFGADLAQGLHPGTIIALNGDLGAGKTVMTQGICFGLGYKGEVNSPSFISINCYQSDIPIYHVDFYLSRSEEDILNLGLDELFNGNNYIIIEWAQKFPNLIPSDTIWINLEWMEDETSRKITVS